MTNTDKQLLLDLIFEYQTAVKQAVKLLNAKSEHTKGFQALAGEIHARAGYLDELGASQYEFHGIGCLVTTKNFTVDFDFGEGGRCDGIDPGFLECFIQYNKSLRAKYHTLNDSTQLQSALQELETDGIVTKDLEPFVGQPMGISNDRLFYLVATIHDADKPVWKPYRPEGWPADDDDF